METFWNNCISLSTVWYGRWFRKKNIWSRNCGSHLTLNLNQYSVKMHWKSWMLSETLTDSNLEFRFFKAVVIISGTIAFKEDINFCKSSFISCLLKRNWLFTDRRFLKLEYSALQLWKSLKEPSRDCSELPLPFPLSLTTWSWLFPVSGGQFLVFA